MNNLPNHMTIGPADDYHEDGLDLSADQIPRWWDLTWERGELVDEDIDQREEYYIMTADCDGITYEGTGVYSCGELIIVDNIEIKK